MVTAYRLAPNFPQRVDSFIEFKGERTRPEMWHIARELWRDRPLVGNGGGSYVSLMEKHRREGLWESAEYAHNDYLNLLSDYGAVGFILLIFPLGFTWWRGLRSRPASGSELPISSGEGRALAWGLAILAVSVVIDFHLQSPAAVLLAGTLLGLMIGQSRRKKRKTNAFFTNQFL